MFSPKLESPKATTNIPIISSSHKEHQSESESQPSPIETPISNQPPPTISSPTPSSSSSYHSRKNQTPKNFVASTSPPATPEKMVEEELVEGEEGTEVSSQRVEEATVDKEDIASLGEASGVSTIPSGPTFDLSSLSPSGNASLASTDSSLLDVSEK